MGEYMKDLKITEIFDLLYSLKDSKEIVYLDSYNVSKVNLDVARSSANIRILINNNKEAKNVESYQRKDADKIDFMSLLSETHLSSVLYSKFYQSNKQMKILSPSIASFFLDKTREDFRMNHKEKQIDFDLKCQYYKSNTDSQNINQKKHKECIEMGADFYIVAFFKNKDNDYNNYEAVERVDYFLVPIDFVTNNSISVNTSYSPKFSPYYKIPTKYFKDKLPLNLN